MYSLQTLYFKSRSLEGYTNAVRVIEPYLLSYSNLSYLHTNSCYQLCMVVSKQY